MIAANSLEDGLLAQQMLYDCRQGPYVTDLRCDRCQTIEVSAGMHHIAENCD